MSDERLSGASLRGLRSRQWTLEEKNALSACFDTIIAILPKVPVERQLEFCQERSPAAFRFSKWLDERS